jgi:hypothetical protein
VAVRFTLVIDCADAAGLHSAQWHRLYAVIIQAVTATK